MKISINTLKQILIAILLVIAFNWISSIRYGRFDLTQDKRYTLHSATKDYLENLQDTIRFSIYLEGDLPMSFIKMKQEVSDLIYEFKRIAGPKVQILFIDPASLAKGKSSLKHAYNRLMQYGLKPYTIQEENENGKIEQRFIIPGIIVSTTQNYVPINLLANTIGNTTEEQIYSALQQLEYVCIKSMSQLTANERKNIAFLTDHKEYGFPHVYDITLSLMESYNVDRISTKSLLDSITKYELVIIAQPQAAFSETDKFIIDQYIMHGGNLLYTGDPIGINLDSLKLQSHTTAYQKDMQNSDLLFNFGVRINTNIILDNQCAMVPYNVMPFGSQPRFEPAPWYYFPLLRPKADHIITKNIDVIKSEFASTIDTLEGNGFISKTVLLTTSAYSRTIGLPNPVGFSILQNIPNKDYFNKYFLPVGVLLEGTYNSLYKNRPSPIAVENLPKDFSIKKESNNSKIIVVADGDILRNEIEIKGFDTVPKPLHYYKYFAIDKRVYTGNKDFIMNAVYYLCNDSYLLSIRSRELKIRLLNKNRINEERKYWQIFNIVLPILLVSIGGLIILLIRKRKYSKTYVG